MSNKKKIKFVVLLFSIVNLKKKNQLYLNLIFSYPHLKNMNYLDALQTILNIVIVFSMWMSSLYDLQCPLLQFTLIFVCAERFAQAQKYFELSIIKIQN